MPLVMTTPFPITGMVPIYQNFGKTFELLGSGCASCRFGSGMALSANGNTLIGGEPGFDSPAADTGRVHIYQRDRGSPEDWVLEVILPSPLGTIYNAFGGHIGISSDGNTVVFNSNASRAHIYVRSGSPMTWSQAQDIFTPFGDFTGGFGDRVGISGDGNTIVIGNFTQDDPVNNGGVSYAFTRTAGSPEWEPQARLLPEPHTVGERNGSAVATSYDGNVIATSSPQDGWPNSTGAVHVFERDSGSPQWNHVQKIVAPTRVVGAGFGSSVTGLTVSGDGNTILIGAGGEDGSRGASYVFIRSGGSPVWELEERLTAESPIVGESFGKGTALTYDGNIAVIAGDPTSFRTYVFTRFNGAWTQQEFFPIFGEIVGISDDGNTIAGGHDSYDGIRGRINITIR